MGNFSFFCTFFLCPHGVLLAYLSLVHAAEKEFWYRLSRLYQILYRFLDTFHDRGFY